MYSTTLQVGFPYNFCMLKGGWHNFGIATPQHTIPKSCPTQGAWGDLIQESYPPPSFVQVGGCNYIIMLNEL